MGTDVRVGSVLWVVLLKGPHSLLKGWYWISETSQHRLDTSRPEKAVAAGLWSTQAGLHEEAEFIIFSKRWAHIQESYTSVSPDGQWWESCKQEAGWGRETGKLRVMARERNPSSWPLPAESPKLQLNLLWRLLTKKRYRSSYLEMVSAECGSECL